MHPTVLYLIALCHGFTPASPPCSAPFFYADHDINDFQRTRENCLSVARAIEAKDLSYQAYCLRSNGDAPLNSSGRRLSEKEFYVEIDRWHAVQDGKRLSSK